MPTSLPSIIQVLPQYGTDPGEIVWRKPVAGGSNPYWCRIGGGITAAFGIIGEDTFPKFALYQSGKLALYGDTVPNLNITWSLGETAFRWKKLFVQDIDMSGSFIGDIGSGFVTITTVQTITGKKTFSTPSTGSPSTGYHDLTIHLNDTNNNPGITLKCNSVRTASWYADLDNCFRIHADVDDPDPAFRITQDKQVFINYPHATPEIPGYNLHIIGNSNFKGHLHPAQDAAWDIGNGGIVPRLWDNLYVRYGQFRGPNRGGFSLNVEIRDTSGDRPGIIFQQIGGVSCGAIVSTNDYAFALYSKDEANRFSIRQDGHIFTYGLAVVGEDPINFNADSFISIKMSVNNIKKARYSAGDTMCLSVQNSADEFVVCVTQLRKVLINTFTPDYTNNVLQISGNGLSIGNSTAIASYPFGQANYWSQIVMKGQSTNYNITVNDGSAYVNHYFNCFFDGTVLFRYLQSGIRATRFSIGDGIFTFQVSSGTPIAGDTISWINAIVINNDGSVNIPLFTMEGAGFVTIETTQIVTGSKTFTGSTRIGSLVMTKENSTGEGGQINFEGSGSGNASFIDNVNGNLRYYVNGPGSFHVFGNTGGSALVSCTGDIKADVNIIAMNDSYSDKRVRCQNLHLERDNQTSIYFHANVAENADSVATADWRIYTTTSGPLLFSTKNAIDRFGFAQYGLLNIIGTSIDAPGVLVDFGLMVNKGISIGSGAGVDTSGNAQYTGFHKFNPGTGDKTGTLDLEEYHPRAASIMFHNVFRSTVAIWLSHDTPAPYKLCVSSASTSPGEFSFAIRNAANTLDAVSLKSNGFVIATAQVECDVLVVNHQSTVIQAAGVQLKKAGVIYASWQAGASVLLNILNAANTSFFTIFQNGHTAINTIADNGQNFYVNGNARFATDVTADIFNATSSFKINNSIVINSSGQFVGGFAPSSINTGNINCSNLQIGGVTVIDGSKIYIGNGMQCNSNVFGSLFGIQLNVPGTSPDPNNRVGQDTTIVVGGQTLRFFRGLYVGSS